MGIRVEFILSLAIGLILGAVYFVKIDKSAYHKTEATKELEFTDTTFVEVDTNRTLGLAYSDHGVYESKIWMLSGVTYYTDSINYLKANNAIYKEDIVHLDGNVTLYQKEGYNYQTEHAFYNKRSEELEITSPFVGTLGENVIKGEWMLYKVRQKEAFAHKINAVVYTNEK